MSNLFCTWTHRANLPPSLHSQFGDLDYLILSLISAAHERLLLVAPYLSTSGMERVRGALAAAAENGVWIGVGP